MMKCEGCRCELKEAYKLQELGYNVGITYCSENHIAMFAMDDEGNLIAW